MSRLCFVFLLLASSSLLTHPFQVANMTSEPDHSLDSDPSPMLQLQPGLILFAANDGVHGRELWRTDGTPGNAHLVRDIHPGAQGSNPRLLTLFGNRVCFSADDGTHGRELWCSDGTEPGTYMVRDILPGPQSSELGGLSVVGNSLLFHANDGVHGDELWRSDGSEAGTVLVTDLRPGPADSQPLQLTHFNGIRRIAVLGNTR